MPCRVFLRRHRRAPTRYLNQNDLQSHHHTLQMATGCFHLFGTKVERLEVGAAFPRTTSKLRPFGPE